MYVVNKRLCLSWLEIKYGFKFESIMIKFITFTFQPQIMFQSCFNLVNSNGKYRSSNARSNLNQTQSNNLNGVQKISSVFSPQRFPIYTQRAMEIYIGKRRNEVPPHIFAIAEGAFQGMMTGGKNQSILIT